jgi:hypothetical protein
VEAEVRTVSLVTLVFGDGVGAGLGSSSGFVGLVGLGGFGGSDEFEGPGSGELRVDLLPLRFTVSLTLSLTLRALLIIDSRIRSYGIPAGPGLVLNRFIITMRYCMEL